MPAALIRGYVVPPGEGTARDLVMPPERDLFCAYPGRRSKEARLGQPQILGALLILAAFASRSSASSTRSIATWSRTSSASGWRSTLARAQLGFLVLEAAWAIVSAWAVKGQAGVAAQRSSTSTNANS